MKALVALFLTSTLLCSCVNEAQFTLEPEIAKPQAPKIKTKTTVKFYRVKYNPDSSFFDKKTITEFDSSGVMISHKVFIIDSTILFSHEYRLRQGDSLLKIKYRLDNFYKNTAVIDTSVYVNDRLVFTKLTKTYREEYSGKKEVLRIPIPSYRSYRFEDSLLIEVINEKGDQQSFEQYFYNNEGKLQRKEISRSDEPGFKYTESYRYNERGLKIRQIELSVRDEDTLGIYHRTYAYDQNDSLIKWANSRNGITFLKELHEFDSLGRKRVTYAYNDLKGDSSLLTGVIYFHYDMEGRLQEKEWLHGDLDPFTSWHYFYNEEGFLKEERRYSYEILPSKKLSLQSVSTRSRYEYYE